MLILSDYPIDAMESNTQRLHDAVVGDAAPEDRLKIMGQLDAARAMGDEELSAIGKSMSMRHRPTGEKFCDLAALKETELLIADEAAALTKREELESYDEFPEEEDEEGDDVWD